MASGLLVAAQYSLVQAIGEPQAFLGVLSACLGAGSIVASLVSGRLLRHVGEGGLAVLGMINFAIGCALRSTGVLGSPSAGALILASPCRGSSWPSSAWPSASPRWTCRAGCPRSCR